MSDGKWHGGKGDKTRGLGGNTYADNWETIFGKPKPDVKVRKITPDHSKTAVHKDKSKPRRVDYKEDLRKQRDLNWDGNDD